MEENTFQGVRLLTKRDYALGALSKKIYMGDGRVTRFIGNDAIVEFKVSNRYSTNAEFTINNNSDWRMWFSQFDPVFLNEDTLGLEGGSIVVNGIQRLIATLDINEFIDLVEGRKFRVYQHSDCYAMDFRNNEKCRRFRNAGAVQKHIKAALDAEEYSKVEGILKVMPMYDLVEAGYEEAFKSSFNTSICNNDIINEDMLHDEEEYENYWEEEFLDDPEPDFEPDESDIDEEAFLDCIDEDALGDFYFD